MFFLVYIPIYSNDGRNVLRPTNKNQSFNKRLWNHHILIQDGKLNRKFPSSKQTTNKTQKLEKSIIKEANKGPLIIRRLF